MFAFSLLIPTMDPVVRGGRVITVLPDPDIPVTNDTGLCQLKLPAEAERSARLAEDMKSQQTGGARHALHTSLPC